MNIYAGNKRGKRERFRRYMSRGQKRQEKRRKQKKNQWILGVALFLVLSAGYLIACTMAKGETIVRNVYVNEVKVGGLDEQKAAEKIQQKFEKDYADASLIVKANGQNYKVPMYTCLAMDAWAAAKEAMAYARGSFLTRGFALLKAELFKEKITWHPQIKEEGLLVQCIDQSGLLAINTTVQTTYEVTKDSLVFTKGKTGVSVDRKGLIKAIRKAVGTADYETVIESPMLTGKVEPTDVQAVYDQIHTKKKNATLDPKNDYKIVKSVRGISFDVESARTAFAAAAEGEQVIVPLKVKKPKISTKNLKKHLFKDVLGSCTTNVSGSYARISNVALAAKTLNGKILLPGETFSYNDALGQRTADRGYKSAPAYSNGQSVQELGGGICQVSSTLYKATLLSDLEIVEHHNHSYVSAYIGIGMDATVSWGGPDYQFKNNTDYPIKISAVYSGGQITCKLYGAKLNDHKVEMVADTLKVNGRGTVYQDDPTLERGKTEVVSSGHDGYVVQTYRKVYDGDGKLLSSKKEAYCVYRKQDTVIRRGTKEPEITEPALEEGTTAMEDLE